jgi:hypothetical protein
MSFLSPSFGRWRAIGALAGALAAFAPRPAHAHYGIPHAFSVLFEPGTPTHMVLRSDIWGLMYSQDAGKSWQWTCAEAYGGSSSAAEHDPMVVTPGGRVVVALTYKGVILSDDMCNWRSGQGMDGQYVMDVALTSTSVLALTSTNAGDAGFKGAVYSSSDNGEHWSTASAQLPNDFLGSSVAMAPSDSQRLYVAGSKIEADKKFERSSDGGKTWVRSDLPVSADKNFATVRIPAVHPTRPDVVFVWVDQSEALNADSPDDILASADGGATWKNIYASTGDLPGFAISPDGKTIAIAGPNEGVQTADLDDALARGQAAFTQVFKDRVWGLHWTADGLYAGNNNFTARDPVTQITPPAYMLGVSNDGGHTFTQLMNMCQITYGSCAKGTMMDNACNGLWDDKNLGLGFGYDYVYGERCVKPDGGTGTSSHKDSVTSSGCSFSGLATGSDRAGAALLLLGLGVLLRRRSGARAR